MAVRDAFAQAGEQLRDASVGLPAEPDPQLARHGRLSPAQRSEVRLRGYAAVIAPAAADLLASWQGAPMEGRREHDPRGPAAATSPAKTA